MDNERGETPRHPIRVVARRTGLTPALLRAWEKRYGVVTPSRSDGGQRLYSDEDVHRLGLLHRVVDEGRSISQVASLSVRELEALVEEDQSERMGIPYPEPLGTISVLEILERARRAVRDMDPRELERILTRASMAVPVPTLVDDVLVPLLEGIGLSWVEGALGPAQEHMASVVVRRFLEWLMNAVDSGVAGPVLVAATPAGERHELGALLCALSAAAEGWKAYYLGPDLPAPEIASAAERLSAQVVALSVLDPALLGPVSTEISALRGSLSESVRLVVGGPGAVLDYLRDRLPGTETLKSLSSLRESLRGSAVRF